MSNEKNYVTQIEENKTKVKVTLDLDERMRILANLMIDRILDDYRKGQLKFVSRSSNVIMEHQNRDRK
jgi:hypothetical protein